MSDERVFKECTKWEYKQILGNGTECFVLSLSQEEKF
jgi:hypothetical protein